MRTRPYRLELEASPVANPEVAAVCVDGELVLYDESAAALHHLDVRATAVWTRLDGRTLGEVSASLAMETGGQPTRVATDVLVLVERLVADGLVVVLPRQRNGVDRARGALES